MIHKFVTFFVLIFCIIGGWATQAIAQQEAGFIPKKLQLKVAKKNGWFPNLDVGFNFSFAQSDGVVGVPDGTTLNVGVQLEGGLLFSKNSHEWRNTIKIVHTQTKVPTIKSFLKSADQASLESVYTYRLKKMKWFGFFISLKGDTALVDGFLIRDTDTKLKIKEIDGQSKSESLKGQEVYLLTKGLSPFLLKESLGVAVTYSKDKLLKVDVKAGGGVIQAWTREGLRVDDDATTTDVFELTRLQDYIQAGLELKLVAAGILFKKLLNYNFALGAMLPFYSSVTNNLSTIELLNVNMNLKIGLKINKWFSLNYALSLVSAPLIQPKLQITNNLILSFTTSIL